MLYTPSESVLRGNTVVFGIRVYDQAENAVDADQIKVRIVKSGQQVVEPSIETTVNHVSTGKYEYKFETGNYVSGRFTAVWRGKITTADGKPMYFVSEEPIEIMQGELG